MTGTRTCRRERWRAERATLILAAVVLVLAACSGLTPTPTPTPSPAPTAVASPTTVATATATAVPTVRPTSSPTATARPSPVSASPTRAAVTVGRGTPGASPSAFVLTPAGAFARAGLDGRDLRRVAASPADAQTLFAGGAGVWRSTDGGKGWTMVRSAAEAPRVSALVVAPSDARTIYVGVNQGCARGNPLAGWVSTSGGRDWREIAKGITALAVDPQNARLVYATTCNGVLRSADGGVSWDQLGGARLDNYDPTLIAVAPAAPRTLYVAYASEGGTVRLQRSTDGGTTWQDATPPGDLVGPLSLVVDPVAAGSVFLSTTSGLFKSANDGRAWERLSRGLAETVSGSGVDAVYGNTALVADLDRGGYLWLGTGTANAPSVGVFRTRDGGATWSKAANGLDGLEVRSLAIAGPPDRRVLYAATNEGLWVLTNP